MNSSEGKPAISRPELMRLIAWLADAEHAFPEGILDLLRRMAAVYSSFAQSEKRARQTLLQLRQAMGFIPKSERGGRKLPDSPSPDAAAAA